MDEIQAKVGKNDFHKERSLFLDAFASLEEAQRGAANQLQDERLAKLLKSLRAVRNDLVHSQLRFVQLEGKLQAIAINSQEMSTIARPGRVLKIDDFKVLCDQIREVRQAFMQASA